MSFDPDAIPDFAALLRLDHRVVVVLGAGAGMGRQSAHALAQFGARVVCVDRELELAQQVADEVGGLAVSADVTDREDMTRVFAEATALGPVTGLVDVVGIAMIRSLSEFSDDDWDRQFDLTLRHAFLALQLGGRAIAEAGGGSMVFIGSLAGHTYAGSETVYGSAKAALHRLVCSTARELGHKHVRANVLAPGFVRTPRLNQLLNAAQWEQLERDIPRGRAGTPAEIAAAVLFLISELSSYINGQVITADAGMGDSIRVPF